MFKKALNIFLKSKFCVIVYMLFFAGVVGVASIKCLPVSLQYYQNSYLIHTERYFLQFAVFLFILFLFISYEYFAKSKRDNFSECLWATKNGDLFSLNQFLVMEILVLLFTAAFTALSFVTPIVSGIADGRYYAYILKLSLMYFFVADTIAVLLGIAISKIKNNIVSYVLLIVCTFMFSPLSFMIPDTISAVNENIYLHPFFNMFVLFPRDFESLNYDAYGISLNSHNYMLAVFWLALPLCIILLPKIKRNRTLEKAALSVSLVFVIVSGIFVNLPYSEYPYHFDDIKKGYEGISYYECWQDSSKSPMQYNEPADFSLTSMDIKLKIGRQLSAEASVGVDNTKLDSYKFTLFRGYKIKKIMDANGNKLKFDRYSDYVTVYPADSGMTDKITFDYAGWCAPNFSNTQGAYLPTGFAYYPINGFHYTFDLYGQRYTRNYLEKPLPIHLTVDTKNMVYSNLERTADGKNEFSGTSDGLTIVSGFYKETEVEGCRLVYIDYYSQNDKMLEEIAENIRNNKELYQDKALICSMASNTNADNFVDAYDHILFRNSYDLINRENNNEFSPVYHDLYYKILTYHDESSALRQLCDAVSNGNTADIDKNTVDYVLAEKINAYGIEDCLLWLHNHKGMLNEMSAAEFISIMGEKTAADLEREQYEKEMGLV